MYQVLTASCSSMSVQGSCHSIYWQPDLLYTSYTLKQLQNWTVRSHQQTLLAEIKEAAKTAGGEMVPARMYKKTIHTGDIADRWNCLHVMKKVNFCYSDLS